MSERVRRRQNLAEQMAEELGTAALEDRLRIVERMADLDLPTDDESVDSFERLLSTVMSEQTERIEGEVPLPGTEILAGPRPAPSKRGQEECDVCGKFTWLVIHSCSGVPRTEAAKQRYAEREGFASYADLLAARGVIATHPVHPRELDKWVRQTQVPGLTVAVDAAGCIVLHTPTASMTVTSVEGLVGDLRVAVQMRDAMEAPDGE